MFDQYIGLEKGLHKKWYTKNWPITYKGFNLSASGTTTGPTADMYFCVGGCYSCLKLSRLKCLIF